MEDNISFEHIQSNLDKRFDFKSSYSKDENSLYCTIGHTCKYFDTDEFSRKISDIDNNSFSVLSQNIRSLPGKWNEFETYLSSIMNDKFTFSIIALQELWFVPHKFDLIGYSPLQFTVRSGERWWGRNVD